MKDLVFRILGSAPASWTQAALGKQCLLPYYHMVSDECVPHVAPLYAYRNIARFNKDLDLLCRGRRALSLDEFLTATRETNRLPENAFLLTFDDGFREMHDVVAPILEAKGISAVFFVISETLDNAALCFQQKIALLCHYASAAPANARSAALKVLTQHGVHQVGLEAALKSVPWSQRSLLDQLAPIFGVDFAAYASATEPYLTGKQIESLLARGFSIGAHSISHPRYGDIPLEEQLHQTRTSLAALTSRFALKPRTFAFPHTDRGVSAKFFATLHTEGLLDASFGTSGPADDSAPMNFQRFSMEKSDIDGRTLLARHAARRLKQRATHRRIVRTAN